MYSTVPIAVIFAITAAAAFWFTVSVVSLNVALTVTLLAGIVNVPFVTVSSFALASFTLYESSS